MEPKVVTYHRLDDIVFENRNKEYGAYALRKTYSEKVLTGFFASLCLIGMLFFLPEGSVKDKIVPKIIDLPGEHIFIQPPVLRTLPPPPAPTQPTQQIQRTDLPPRVVSDPVVEEPLPPAISSTPVDYTGPVDLSGNATGTATGITSDIPVVTNKPDFVLAAEVMPAYEGGFEGMMKFIKKKLRYPSSAARMQLEGTVYVSFVINGDGSIRNVEVIKGFHPDCDREAARVIAMMPGWTGGSHGGYPVAVKMVLPITFKLNK